MGTYVSEGDLIPALVEERIAVQLTNDEVDGDTVVSSVVESAIEEAEAEVNGYLGVRYLLPLTEVPTLVTALAQRLARYRLYARRPGAVEEWLQKDHDAVVKLLARISKGEVSLGLQPTATPNPDLAVRSASIAPVFGRDNLGDF